METTTLSPKETIINILGRLFNNGHISSDELSIMQQELLINNPPVPEAQPDALPRDMVQRLIEEFLKTPSSPFPPPSNTQVIRRHEAASGLSYSSGTLPGGISLLADTGVLSGGLSGYVDANSLKKL
jgi:hypothetical protein